METEQEKKIMQSKDGDGNTIQPITEEEKKNIDN